MKIIISLLFLMQLFLSRPVGATSLNQASLDGAVQFINMNWKQVPLVELPSWLALQSSKNCLDKSWVWSNALQVCVHKTTARYYNALLRQFGKTQEQRHFLLTELLPKFCQQYFTKQCLQLTAHNCPTKTLWVPKYNRCIPLKQIGILFKMLTICITEDLKHYKSCFNQADNLLKKVIKR